MILSGRSLPDIKKRIGIRKIYYGGNHGLDISGPHLRYKNPNALSAIPLIKKVKKLLAKEIKNIRGVWLEDKKFTMSLHFRSVKKENISVVKKKFYKTVTEFLNKPHIPQRDTKVNKNVIPAKLVPAGLKRGAIHQGIGFLSSRETLDSRLHRNDKLGEQLLFIMKGKKVLELIPNTSWDKGKATLYILQRLKEDCLPIYIGDDKTDEDAFRYIHDNGITVRVGRSRKTLAHYYLKRQREVSEFLRRIISYLEKRDM
jgi:HAD superfamily hydrolase (TIGR01484 family)